MRVWDGFPGFYPGLVELALQAGIAEGLFVFEVLSVLVRFGGPVPFPGPLAFVAAAVPCCVCGL
jgi:hypothetical protein